MLSNKTGMMKLKEKIKGRARIIKGVLKVTIHTLSHTKALI